MHSNDPGHAAAPPVSSAGDGSAFIPAPPPNVAAGVPEPRPRRPLRRLSAFVRSGVEALLEGAAPRCARCHSPHIVPAAAADDEDRRTRLYSLFDCTDCGHRWAQCALMDTFL